MSRIPDGFSNLKKYPLSVFMVSALSGLILEKIYMTFSVGTKKTAAYMRKEGVRPGAGGGGGGDTQKWAMKAE